MSFSEAADTSLSSSHEEHAIGSHLLPRPPLESPSPDTSFEQGTSQYAHEKHPKGKRKRTAAKDKSILETSYVANPKPDKAARLELVQRVSLTEKEVQIWFQNRRQNDRRKSRPLSPQEIAALRTGGMQVLSSDPISSSSQVGDRTSPAAEPCQSTMTNPEHELDLAAKCHDFSASDAVPSKVPEYGVSGDTDSISLTPKVTSSTQLSCLGSPGLPTSLSSSISRFTSRWSLPGSFSTPPSQCLLADGLRNAPFLSSSPPSVSSCSVLPPPQSSVRLSLSLEGKAELVSDAKSPETQRAMLPASTSRITRDKPRPFQRSKSAISCITLPPISALTDSLPASLRRGRSRDAQAWVQCCDSDGRDELTTQAENESSGSALAAISLLRSSSNVLQPNNAKRNAAPTSGDSQLGKKPRLGRALSGGAVTYGPSNDPSSPPATKLSKVPTILRSPSGDSDKENWSPDSERNVRNGPTVVANRRAFGPRSPRTGNARRQGRIMRDQTALWLSSGNRASTMPTGGRRSNLAMDLEIFEDTKPQPSNSQQGSEEVERFMRGEVSPSKKGDMDCIAGLLSLSQGNWR